MQNPETVARRTVLGAATATTVLAATPNASAAGPETLHLAPDTTTVLRNPLTGWVLYGTARPAEDYWSHYDEIGATEFAQTVYFRIGWHVLNPAEGVYGWDVDETLRWMIDNARSRNLRLAFRVVVDSRDKSESFTPSWVREAGARGYETQTGSTTVWSPYPDDAVFQQKYASFIAAFARHFDDEAVVDFVDGYGLGKWGEGHSVRYLDDTQREPVFDWIVDLYQRHFTRVPLALNYHRLIGTPQEWGDPDPDSERLLDSAYEKGYVLRHDAFGMTDYYGDWERALAAKWRFRRPVLMEGGWVTASMRYWIDPRGYQTVADVRRGEYDDSEEAHVNAMDFRINETDTWFTDTPELVRSFVAEGGYRLFPDEISLPRTVRSGSGFEIAHRWNNLGWGYLPNDLPQWDHRYRVAFALLDGRGHHVEQVFVDPDAEPGDWRRGTPTQNLLRGRVGRLRRGRHVWGVAIVDTTRQDRPAIALAARGTVTDDGWLLLGDCSLDT